MNTNRLEEVYDMLVDEMDNPHTYRNERKAHLLRHLIQLVEYLRGELDESPLDDWFDGYSNGVAPNNMMELLEENQSWKALPLRSMCHLPPVQPARR